jgi:hypothetical protein
VRAILATLIHSETFSRSESQCAYQPPKNKEHEQKTGDILRIQATLQRFNGGNEMGKLIQVLTVCALAVLPSISIAGETFDGTHGTKYTCPEKGNTKGFAFVFPTVVQKVLDFVPRGFCAKQTA